MGIIKTKDDFTKDWIIQNSIDVVKQYDDGVLTLRALHYQLVGLGMTNDIQHYKRVVSAMADARWNNLISFETFSDLDRGMIGETPYTETVFETEVENGKYQIKAWMENYHKNRWENQPIYPEIFIEKKALQGVFQDVCRKWDISLGACKGYPSLTFINDAYKRFRDADYEGKHPVIIYFGDYDPSGEDIPRSIPENISRLGIDVELKRIALMEEQVVAWNLPSVGAFPTDPRRQPSPAFPANLPASDCWDRNLALRRVLQGALPPPPSRWGAGPSPGPGLHRGPQSLRLPCLR